MHAFPLIKIEYGSFLMIGFGALDWECIFHKTPPEQGGARRMLRMEQIEAIKRMSRSNR